jgi:hypothetical protein
MSQAQRQNKMIRPYKQGDKHFKVKRTKDGRLAVYDSSIKFGNKNNIVAVFDADEEQDAIEAAENLNNQNDELNKDNIKFFANLKKEMRGESLMQYMDDLIIEQLKRFA